MSGGRRGRAFPTFRDAVVITSPVLFLLAYLSVGAALDYLHHRQFRAGFLASEGDRVRSFFDAKVRSALAFPRLSAWKGRLDAESADPGVVRLRFDEPEWETALGATAAGAWVDATLVRGNDATPVRVRRRGDSSGHWLGPKKSFTLRTSRTRFFNGFRSLAFTSKQVLQQLASHRIAVEFDLLVPYMTAAPVFANDQFYGIYRVAEPVDESFLRSHSRVPGNIFRLDARSRQETFRGLDGRGFLNPYLWDRVAENGVPGVEPTAALFEFVEAINGSTLQDHLRLMNLVDRDEIARFVAAQLVVGDLWHMDEFHNQFWYEDPSTGTLHPIVWDLGLMDIGSMPYRLNAFLRAALRDPFLVDAVLEYVQARISDGSVERAAASARVLDDRYRPHFEYDRERFRALGSTLMLEIGSADSVEALVAKNIETLGEWIADAPTAFHAAPQRPDLMILDFETRGLVGSDLTALELGPRPASMRLFADYNRNGVLDVEDPPMPGRTRAAPDGGVRFELDSPLELLPGWRTADRGIKPGRVHYRLFLSVPSGDLSADAVWPELVNRRTGEPSEVLEWSAGSPVAPGYSWSPWQFPVNEPRTRTLRGDVRLTEDLQIRENERLVIEPGTNLRLDPDVSILASGRVTARGSADRPIRFGPTDELQPWGTLALQGGGADGSLFEHVEFRGGGGEIVGRVVYKGMVTIHRARDVRFLSVTFADNLRSDDALNVVHGDVSLEECTFSNANMDAVDYDYSTGLISGCRFTGPRNDAIDLMTSTPMIVNNDISACGDKGISIGERSAPLIFNNRITNCLRAVEVKDRSEPVLLDNRFEGNDVAVLQQVKNWRYRGGGWAKLGGSQMVSNRVDVEADDRSRLTSLQPADSAWIHALYGIDRAPGGGATTGRRAGEVAVPVVERRFRDGFGALSDWAVSGGATGVAVRDDNLVVTVRRSPGSAAIGVDWDLTDGGRYLLVLEVGGRGLDSASVVVRSSRGDLGSALPLAEAPSEFRYHAMELPPGSYSALELRAVPAPARLRTDPNTGLQELSSARLRLHGYRVFRLGGDRRGHSE